MYIIHVDNSHNATIGAGTQATDVPKQQCHSAHMQQLTNPSGSSQPIGKALVCVTITLEIYPSYN